MRAILQRVKRGAVYVDGRTTGAIHEGLVVLVGVTHEDALAEAERLASKTAHLRIFEDEKSKFNLSLLEVSGEVLVISQFTLHGNCRKGRRPSFDKAAGPQKASALFGKFVELLSRSGLKVETGCFQQHMMVEIHNEGPVTILLDSSF